MRATSCSFQAASRSAWHGDLLGIDGVRLDPGARVRLVVAGSLERGLLIPDLDLEALASARLLGDRAERIEGAGLLLDLEGGCVALRRQLSDGSLPTSPSSCAVRAFDLGDVRLLAAEHLLGLGQVGQAQRTELRRDLDLESTELRLHLGAAAQAPVDLDIAQLGLHLVAAPEPEGDGGEGEADQGDDGADDLDQRRPGRRCSRSSRTTGPAASRIPIATSATETARQRLPGGLRLDLELDLDLAGQRRLELADPAVEGAKALDRGADDGQRVR